MTAHLDGLAERLSDLLDEVFDASGPTFTGTGVIVTTTASLLPILPLRRGEPDIDGVPTPALLRSLSVPDGEYHDGFHVLDPRLRPVHIAQYFSPPIVPEVTLDRTRRFGGRYVAALFGSILPGVLATGIASRDFGTAVFVDGREVRYGRAA